MNEVGMGDLLGKMSVSEQKSAKAILSQIGELSANAQKWIKSQLLKQKDGTNSLEITKISGQGKSDIEKVLSGEEKKMADEEDVDVQKVYENRKLKQTAEEFHKYGGFDSSVNELLKRKAKGDNCYFLFNGKYFYSVDINSVDDAYMQFHGKTKSEYDRDLELAKRASELEEKQRQLEVSNKLSLLIGEGKKYIDQTKWKDWEEYVNNCIGIDDLCSVESMLVLLKMVAQGEAWKRVESKIYKMYGLDSFMRVRKRLVDFSKKGKEVDQNLIVLK